MDNPITPKIPILKAAWGRYAELDAASRLKTRGHNQIRRWIAVLGVLATLFAVLTQIYPTAWPEIGEVLLKLFLIATPVAGALVAKVASERYSSGDWLAMRAGAEGIQREIYTYRTILQKTPDRRLWLEKRLADIQRQVYRSLGGKLVLKTYKGELPPYYQAGSADSDPGFHDLTGDEYFRLRLSNQLAWHIKKVNQLELEQKRLSNWIMIAGGTGTVLAGVGSGFESWSSLTLWVAVSAAIASALMGWEELRNLDATIKNYSKVILELELLADHWENLEPEERSEAEFYQMVQSTEEILWSQNIEYIKSMQEALASVKDEQAELVDQALKQARAADSNFKRSLRDQLSASQQATLEAAQEEMAETFEEAMQTVAAQATSEAVQQELAAVASAVGLFTSQMQERIKAVAEEFAGVEFAKETPKEVLNARLSKYPLSGELKG